MSDLETIGGFLNFIVDQQLPTYVELRLLPATRMYSQKLVSNVNSPLTSGLRFDR
jgi:hypothetical protein